MRYIMQTPSQIIVFFNSPDNTLIKMVYPSFYKFFYAFDISLILNKFTKPENVIYYEYNKYQDEDSQRYFYATDEMGNWIPTSVLLTEYNKYKKYQEKREKKWQFRCRKHLYHDHRRHIHTIQEQKYYFIDPDSIEIGMPVKCRPSRSKINEVRYENWRSNEKCWKCQSKRPKQWR